MQLRRCNNSTSEYVCKTDKEIDDFMNGKYLLLLNNQIRFDSLLYGRESIIKESIITWNKVSIQKQEGLIFEVQRSELELQDLLFDFDEITMLQD